LESILDFVPHIIRRQNDLTSVLVHTIDLRIAVLHAIHGDLDVSLISHSQMLKVMHNVRAHVRQFHPSLHLAYRSPGEAYQSHDFLVSRVHGTLYISVKFTISSVRHPFVLYDVRTFPVVMPDDSDHFTQLHTDVRFFAYSTSMRSFMQFTGLPDITHHMLDLSSTTEVFYSLRSPTCVAALYLNSPSHIRQLCDFRLLPHALQPSVLSLDSSIILFTNVSQITRRCTGRPDLTLPPCKQCIYRLPCGCTFRTKSAYIPPIMTKCGPLVSNDSQSPYSHVVNLAVLSQFFSEKDLGDLGTDSILRRPISAVLPDFEVYQHNTSALLAVSDKAKFDLQNAVSLSIQRQTAYRSLADYLNHKHFQLQPLSSDQSTWFTIPLPHQSIILFITSIIAVIALAFSVVLSIRLRALSVLIITARPASASYSAKLDFFRYLSTTNPSAATSSSTSSSDWLDLTFVEVTTLTTTVFVVLIFLFLLVYIIIKCHYNSHKKYPGVTLYIQFPTLAHTCYLRLLDLPYNLACYTISATKPPISLTIDGFFRPTLIMDWSDLIIRHDTLDITINIPSRLPLSMFEAKILRQLLISDKSVPIPQLYSYRPDFSAPVPITINFDWDINVISEHLDRTPSAPTDDVNIKRLYPIV